MIELDFKVDVTNMIATLQRGERQLDANIDTFLNDAGERITNAVKEKIPVFSEEARGSIKPEPFGSGDEQGVRISSNLADQALMLTIEGGRRSGQKPPPAKALLPWVQEKWGGDLQDAFMLARKIGIEGSHKYPDGHRPFGRTAEKELPLLEYLAAEIVNIF